jgi:hypothetical protein
MIRKTLLGCLACTLVASLVFAEESPVSVTLSSSVTSTYVWNGFDRVESFGLQSGPSVQPRVSVGVVNTGLSVDVGGSFVVNDNSELQETTYGAKVVRQATPVVQVGAGYTYYDNRVTDVVGVGAVPDMNGHEFWGSVVLSSSVGVKPAVTFKYEKPTVDGYDGYGVVVGSLGYGLPLSGVTVGGAGVDVNWNAGVVYNTGFKVNDVERVKSGVSAVQFGVSSDVKAGRVVVTPSVNYQVSVEDTVNDENEFWATVGVAWGF